MTDYVDLIAVLRRCAEIAADAIDALRAELAEARALYVGAQEDLNEAVGSVVALRAELAEAEALAVAEHAAWQTMADRTEIAEAAIARVRRGLEARA